MEKSLFLQTLWFIDDAIAICIHIYDGVNEEIFKQRFRERKQPRQQKKGDQSGNVQNRNYR